VQNPPYVFLDVKGAFHNTYFASVDDAASDHGVCSTINKWIDFMLRSRSVFVDIRGVTVAYECATWLSTGRCTIASLWNIVADSLLNRLANCNCFSDDVVILISGKFLSTICDLMQRALNCVQNWCGEIGLNVNAVKISILIFTKRMNLEGFFAPNSFLRSTASKSLWYHVIYINRSEIL
jgi:hypothetical protein